MTLAQLAPRSIMAARTTVAIMITPLETMVDDNDNGLPTDEWICLIGASAIPETRPIRPSTASAMITQQVTVTEIGRDMSEKW